MLYLGIDQHARQITISLRDENGDVIEARQVSTKPEKIHDFFQRLTAERLKAGEKFIAVLEVCVSVAPADQASLAGPAGPFCRRRECQAGCGRAAAL